MAELHPACRDLPAEQAPAWPARPPVSIESFGRRLPARHRPQLSTAQRRSRLRSTTARPGPDRVCAPVPTLWWPRH